MNAVFRRRFKPGRKAALFTAVLTIGAFLSVAPRAQAAPTATLGSFNMPADANIWGAGHVVAPDPGGSGGGELPTKVALPTGSTGSAVTLSNVTGSTSDGSNGAVGPDGGYDSDLPVNISSYGGISGVIGPDGFGGSLVAVFTSATEPADPAPAAIDYTVAGSTTQLSYSPLLDQVYFVGDGLTGTGTGQQQQFVVPQGATTLWLGFFDAGFFQGAPGAFSDDTGSINATPSLGAPPTDSNLLNVLYKPSGPVTGSKYFSNSSVGFTVFAEDVSTAHSGLITLSAVPGADALIGINNPMTVTITYPGGASKVSNWGPRNKSQCIPAGSTPAPSIEPAWVITRPGNYEVGITFAPKCSTTLTGTSIWVSSDHPVKQISTGAAEQKSPTLPPPSTTITSGPNDCSALVPGSMLWQWYGPSHLTAKGEDEVGGTVAVSTYNAFCYTSAVQLFLQVRQKGVWNPIAQSDDISLPPNGTVIVPSVTHTRLSGNHSYRLEFAFTHPTLDLSDDVFSTFKAVIGLVLGTVFHSSAETTTETDLENSTAVSY